MREYNNRAQTSPVLEISFKNGKSKKGLLKSIKDGLFAFRDNGVSENYYKNNAGITAHIKPIDKEDKELLNAALAQRERR